MIKDNRKIEHYYNMLVNKSSQHEGVFYVGVITTGIFCRPTCPARKPKKENCEFYQDAQEAVLAGYRPCKRCQPLSLPAILSPEVKKLVEAIEQDPTKKWTDADFNHLSMSANTARRQFKKQFGMTFIAYARSRRLGLAFRQIREGEKVIEGQLNAGYDSSNGFRDAFTKTMGELPKKADTIKALKSMWIETQLGPMIAIADNTHLYLLEFTDRRGLENELKRMREKYQFAIIPGSNPLLLEVKKQLEDYFSGVRKRLDLPCQFLGTPYQQKIWKYLMEIPPGETISYEELAIATGNPKSFRAAANANGKNQLAILVPCHRVINKNGMIGGYGGGIERKQFLLELEKH